MLYVLYVYNVYDSCVPQAVHNTAMLELYSRIDPRCRILGYVMKDFAKACGICDASQGSLSPYAYRLMVIYYLQRTSPPVLPVLQEVGKSPCDVTVGSFRPIEGTCR